VCVQPAQCEQAFFQILSEGVIPRDDVLLLFVPYMVFINNTYTPGLINWFHTHVRDLYNAPRVLGYLLELKNLSVIFFQLKNLSVIFFQHTTLIADAFEQLNTLHGGTFFFLIVCLFFR
jgi:hypothetical protein